MITVLIFSNINKYIFSIPPAFVWLTQTVAWCSTSRINHFGRLVTFIFLKIRKSKFSVIKHYFRGRSLSTLVCQLWRNSINPVLSTLIQSVKKNQAECIRDQLSFSINSEPTIRTEWLESMDQRSATDIQIKKSSTSSVAKEDLLAAWHLHTFQLRPQHSWTTV